ncbi:MAG: hypothetical protein V4598_20010 [Bdellovibrionota bacterium]
MKLIALTILLSAFSGMAFGCGENGGFLPENNMRIPVGAKSAGGLTEAQFNAVIDKLEPIYSPIVANRGGKLKINRKWTDETVNANATQFFGTWTVNMFGGLARHEKITADGFALVLCHELGHHLGGAPKVANFMMKWASNEGESDYFATLKCLRTAWWNDNNERVISKMKAPEALTAACSKAFGDKAERALCVRGGMAGASVAALFAAMRSKPEAQFETPDAGVVTSTNDAHPAHQCRLDTYFQGALCEKAHTEDVSQKEEVQGTCHGSTGHTVGLRPTCWFKPKVL